MRLVRLTTSAFFLLCLGATGRAHAQLELKNDSFVTGQAAGFQSGFVDGEIGAARFVAPSARQLLSVRLLFGPDATTETITLQVWDDSAGTTAPGALIFDGDFQLTGSASNMHELDVSGMNVFVPMQFRVGIQFQHDGVPAIARDSDGNFAPGRNFIFFIPGGWGAAFPPVPGDWIIRAVVADGGGTPDAGVTPDANTGSPDASTGGPDAGSGNVCTGNGDCEIGEYCDLDVRTCTFDCRHDSDCPGSGECNSLGQCIGADGGGGGCCETSSSGGAGALGAIGLAGLVGLVVARRRRSRACEGTGPGSRAA